MTKLYDGHTTSTPPSKLNRFPQYAIGDLRVAVVTGAVYPEEDKSRYRNFVEYEAKDLNTGEIYTGLRRMQMNMGVDDGDEDTLQPATMWLDGRADAFHVSKIKGRDTNGDQVLLGFINGHGLNGVILGVLGHPGAAYGASRAILARRISIFKDTVVERLGDGSYTLRRDTEESKIQMQADGTLLLERGENRVQIDDDIKLERGTSHVHVNDNVEVEGAQIRLGDSAVQPVVLGTSAAVLFSSIQTASVALSAAVLPLASAQLPDTLLPIPTLLTANAVQALLQAVNLYALAIQAAAATFPDALATKVKAE